MSVTNLSTQVAGLNNQISRSEAIGGQPANDLRDQRDQLIAQINRLVNVSTLRQADGSLNVYIGNGQPLVVGGSANAMTAVSDPSNNQLKQPALTIGGVTISLAASMVAGGQLGGVLGVRDEVVLPAVRELNRLALAFADQFNTRHLLGFDKNGAAGTEFFTPVATMLQQPQPFAGTSGAATLTLTDSSQLEASDYLLSYDGANFTLTRLSDGASSTGGIGAVTTINGQDQGFTLAVAGEAAGDRWLVRPSADAAGLFDVAIADPDAIAASGASADSPGDNSNALALAGLRVNGGFGGVSFDGTYNALISRTASLASESDLNLAAFTSLTAQAESARQSASGVNLDEEAVNLIRFQQAYQASAKAIQVATTLFDELLAMVR
jgi:flagellar hook-associated protein 1 FlgK